MLLSGSPLFAQPSSSNSSKQLIVTSASVDRLNDTVTLKGSGFGNKKPTVFCELTQMTVLSATDEELLVAFPASVLDGTYLFTVARGNGTSERATFFVTTESPADSRGPAGPDRAQGAGGTAGPEGPKGTQGCQRRHRRQGRSGPQGLEGPQGPAGPGRTAGIARGRRASPDQPVLQGRAGLDRADGAELDPPVRLVAPGISGYERFVSDSGTLQMNPGVSSFVTAVCPAGKRVIAGGHELASSASQQLNVTMSAPFESTRVGLARELP